MQTGAFLREPVTFVATIALITILEWLVVAVDIPIVIQIVIEVVAVPPSARVEA